jgi:hypothetical protein
MLNTKDKERRETKRCAGYAEQKLASSNIIPLQTSQVNHSNLIKTHYEPKLYALSLD